MKTVNKALAVKGDFKRRWYADDNRPSMVDTISGLTTAVPPVNEII